MYSKQLSKIKKELNKAESYDEWKELAQKYDEVSGMEAWKQVNYSDLYDNDEIYLRLETLRAYREQGDDQGLLFTLNEGVHGNMGGMGNPRLYEKALFGTKQLIVDYVDEVVDAIHGALSKMERVSKRDDSAVNESVRIATRRCFRRLLNKRPIVDVHVVRV